MSEQRTPPPGTEVSGLLARWSRGDRDALDQLMPLVYAECRQIATRQLAAERDDHTLEPAALVHELYLRLVEQQTATWANRAQFFAVAATLMRRVLVDHARAHRAAKRGGEAIFVSLGVAEQTPSDAHVADVMAIDEALGRLGELDPEQVRIVELRYFAGLTIEETAQVVGRSPRTVKREWQLARAWLYRELREAAGA